MLLLFKRLYHYHLHSLNHRLKNLHLLSLFLFSISYYLLSFHRLSLNLLFLIIILIQLMALLPQHPPLPLLPLLPWYRVSPSLSVAYIPPFSHLWKGINGLVGEFLAYIDLLAKVLGCLNCLLCTVAKYILFDFIYSFETRATVYLLLNALFLFLIFYHLDFRIRLA